MNGTKNYTLCFFKIILKYTYMILCQRKITFYFVFASNNFMNVYTIYFLKSRLFDTKKSVVKSFTKLYNILLSMYKLVSVSQSVKSLNI